MCALKKKSSEGGELGGRRPPEILFRPGRLNLPRKECFLGRSSPLSRALIAVHRRDLATSASSSREWCAAPAALATPIASVRAARSSTRDALGSRLTAGAQRLTTATRAAMCEEEIVRRMRAA